MSRTATLLFALLSIGGSAAGCVDARPEEASCVTAPRSVVEEIAQQLEVDGSLRHGSLRTSDGLTFITAELVRDGDPEGLRGDLLTWATGSLDGGDFFSVDIYARESSTWPAAPFDVRHNGVIDSRACTAFDAGDPDPASNVNDDDTPDGDDVAPTTSIGF